MTEFKQSPSDTFGFAEGTLTALLDVLQLASWQSQEIAHSSISCFTTLMQKELQEMKDAFEELENEADRELVAQFQAEAAIRADRAKARKRQRTRATS